MFGSGGSEPLTRERTGPLRVVASGLILPQPPQWPSGISVGNTQIRLASRGQAPFSASRIASVTSAMTLARFCSSSRPSGTDGTTL